VHLPDYTVFNPTNCTPTVNVKFTQAQAMYLQNRRTGTVLVFFFNLGARWGGCSTPHPDRFTTVHQSRYTLYRRLGLPQGLSQLSRKSRPYWNCTSNNKYLFAPPTRVGPYTPSSGNLLRKEYVYNKYCRTSARVYSKYNFI
jgi:hypothetical protein